MTLSVFFSKLRRYLIMRRLDRIRYCAQPRFYRRRTKLYSRLWQGGTGVLIKDGVTLDNPDRLKIGSRVSIQRGCLLSAYGGLTIGDDVSIGAQTVIVTTDHPYASGIIRNNELAIKPVTIGSNVFIGACVVILGGVTIGDNAVVGAGSVVTKDIPSNSVYAGNPAKLIKKIGERDGHQEG